ncbi:hypothetical protein GCM10011583_59200 [Streptomyces camponoticapitis]|uniref:Papain-like cysteine peptidase n=1 Tax=Streptomyces camponoticapitis TaxID=1616125 RepID=A0ABQ2EPI8_9ACTN|nr:DUF1796 family putative cysteine peptidase [Streptomyces camponoticapitis]GGK19486.1 hypothetical protein GCM10011583_59200 [Streptomyces camponoticapitis]
MTQTSPAGPARAVRGAKGPAAPAEAAAYDVCVGLGYHCESTYQLRRITGNDSAHFFDWLDLDLESVVETITGDFAHVLRPGMVEPFSDGLCALDRGSDIRFFHDFRPADPGRPLTQDDIDAQLDGVRAKFAALAERWRALAESPAHVLYVHHDAFDECAARDLRRLRHVIATAHPGQSFSLLWLRRTPPADAGDLPPGIAWGTVAAAPARWEGDDAQWDEVFSAVQMSPDPLWPTPQPRRHPA